MPELIRKVELLPEMSESEFGNWEASNNSHKYDILNGWVAKGLFQAIKEEKSVVLFLDELLGIHRLILESCLSKDISLEKWKEKQEVLSKLHLAEREATGSFYRGRHVNLNDIKDMFLSSLDGLEKFVDPKRCPPLGTDRFYFWKMGLKLPKYLDLTIVNNIIPVAFGGIEPSLLIMDMLGLENLIPIRYGIESKRNPQIRKYPGFNGKDHPLPSFEEGNTLVVEDWMAQGKCISEVIRYISERGAKNIYGVAGRYGFSLPNQDLEINVLFPGWPLIFQVHN